MLDKLRAFLRRHPRVALDTSVFIYQVEGHPRYVPLTDHIFRWLERPESQAITSTITMTELLVHPYKFADRKLVADYYALLATYPNLLWIPPDLETAGIAASLRALHGLKTPDALRAATAIVGRATALITNDAALERVGGFETLVLDRLLRRERD